MHAFIHIAVIGIYLLLCTCYCLVRQLGGVAYVAIGALYGLLSLVHVLLAFAPPPRDDK